MTILNETEMKASVNSLLASGNNTPMSILRETLFNMIESTGSRFGTISGVGESGINIPDTESNAIKLEFFNKDEAPPNELFESNQANNRILIKEPMYTFCRLAFTGEWPANEDLNLQVRINGIVSTLNPIHEIQEGNGASDPASITPGARFFGITQDMIDAGGGEASVEVWAYSTTGPFTADQLSITLAMQYITGSVRTAFLP